MSQGNILVADNQGVYLLKFVGDVRLTLSATIDTFFQQLFESAEFSDLLIDMTQAHNLDSTTLGLLAKIGMTAQKHGLPKPKVYICHPDIERLLASMGLLSVFEIQACQSDQLPEAITDNEAENPLPVVPCPAEELQQKVIDAHKVLMGLSEDNQLRFKNLVEALEAEQNTSASSH